MKTYGMTYKNWFGNWEYERLEATCDTDARFTARTIIREKRYCCGFSLTDFWGNYIEL